MRKNRIFQPVELANRQTLSFDADASNHLAKVLRLQLGDEVIVFNGDGYDYPARLTRIHKKAVEADILDAIAAPNESPLALTLIQGISRSDRMDLTLQKAVELGCTRIIPAITEHSNFRIKAEVVRKKHGHWQRILQSACEQCGRARLPVLEAIQPLEQAMQYEAQLRFILDHRAASGLRPQTDVSSAALLIGPEGGFSEGERQAALSRGFQAVRMGPRVLRTETAAIAAISLIQANYGDLC